MRREFSLLIRATACVIVYVALGVGCSSTSNVSESRGQTSDSQARGPALQTNAPKSEVRASEAHPRVPLPGADLPPMAEFIDALRKQDRERFLTFFSRTTPWSYISTLTDPPQQSQVQFSVLKSDLQRRTGWYETLFDADGDDCFRDWVQGPEGTSWVGSQSNRFVRRRVDGKDSVYVEWRKEGDSWVIGAIAEPAA